jgi:Bacterial PH domain
MSYSPGPPSYTLTPAALTIHDRFYPVTLKRDSIEASQIRVIDLARDPYWAPASRSNGFANSHYQSGWFRLANGQKVRLYRAGGERVVLLPSKDEVAAVLYQAADPEAFAAEIRNAWSASAQSSANAGK